MGKHTNRPPTKRSRKENEMNGKRKAKIKIRKAKEEDDGK
jgi:hypothetical protein